MDVSRQELLGLFLAATMILSVIAMVPMTVAAPDGEDDLRSFPGDREDWVVEGDAEFSDNGDRVQLTEDGPNEAGAVFYDSSFTDDERVLAQFSYSADSDGVDPEEEQGEGLLFFVVDGEATDDVDTSDMIDDLVDEIDPGAGSDLGWTDESVGPDQAYFAIGFDRQGDFSVNWADDEDEDDRAPNSVVLRGNEDSEADGDHIYAQETRTSLSISDYPLSTTGDDIDRIDTRVLTEPSPEDGSTEITVEMRWISDAGEDLTGWTTVIDQYEYEAEIPSELKYGFAAGTNPPGGGGEPLQYDIGVWDVSEGYGITGDVGLQDGTVDENVTVDVEITGDTTTETRTITIPEGLSDDFYSIDGLDPGTYTVSAELIDGNYAIEESPVEVEIEPDDIGNEANFALVDSGSFEGEVLDDGGDPVDTEVTFETPDGQILGTVTPDAGDGSYTLDDIPVGTHDVVASAEGFEEDTVTDVAIVADQTEAGIDFTLDADEHSPAFASAEITDAAPDELRVSFDGDVTATDATGFSVDSPDDAEVDSLITVEDGDTVVLQLNRSIVASEDVSVSYDSESGTIVSDEDGSDAQGFDTEGATNEVDPIEPEYDSAVADDPADEITLTFDAEVTVADAGDAQDDFTAEIDDEAVQVTDVSDHETDADTVVATLAENVTTGDEVELRYDNSQESVVSSEDGSPVAGFSINSDDDATFENDVPEPEPEPDEIDADDVTVTAGGTGHELTATVTDGGSPVEGEAVVVDDDDGLTALDATATTNETGVATFTFDEESADEYTVELALDEDESISETVTVTVDPAAADSTSAEVTEDEATADGTDEVEFTVTVDDAHGNPVPDEEVSVDDVSGVAIDGLSEGSTDTTDTDGVTTFAATTTDSGEVTVAFSAEDSSIEDDATATFVPGAVDSVELQPDADRTAEAGEEIEFSATAKDAHDNVVEDDEQAFDWNNATDGSFTEQDAGSYEVTAELDGVESPPTTVTIPVDPAYDSSTVTDAAADELRVTFDGEVSADNADGFSIDSPGDLTITGLDSASDETVVLALDRSITSNETLSVSYDSELGTVVSDEDGSDAQEFDGETVSNDVESVDPEYESAIIGDPADEIELGFDDDVTVVDSTQAAADLEVTADGVPVPVTDVSSTDSDTLVVSVDEELAAGEEVGLSYDDEQSSIESSADGSSAQAFSIDSETDPAFENRIAEFTIASIDPQDDDIEAGDELDVEVTVENTGESEGTQSIELLVDPDQDGDLNLEADEKSLTLADGQTETITLPYTTQAGDSPEIDVRAASTDDSMTETATVEAAVESVTISLSDPEVAEGVETALTVEAAYTNGTTQNVTEQVTVTSNDTDVATVGADGTVTTEGEGIVEFTATYEDESDSASLSVTEADVIDDGVTVSLADAELPEGTETPVTVEAELTNGSVQNITEQADISSDDTGVATTDGSTVIAESEGTVQIDASYGEETDSAGLTVTAAEVVDEGLTVTVDDAEIPEGTETTLSVQAEFTNGSVQDVTESATLSSSDDGVATVASDGTVTAEGEGTADLTAELGGESEGASIDVTDAAVVDDGLDLTLTETEIPEGTETTLTVKAEFTNGTTLDVTEDADLSSSDDGVASVATDGTVTAEAVGTADLTAEFDGESDSVLAEVTDAEVINGGLNVTLTDSELPAGTETTFSVEAELTNGTTQNVTEQATVTSNDTDVAAVKADGNVTTESEGSVEITAEYDDESDSVSLTVAAAEVVDGGVTVTVDDAELPEGTETTVTVEAEYTNGTTLDVTESANLSSSDDGVATVASDGTVTAEGEGTADLTAELDDESEDASIDVTDAAVVDDGLDLTLTETKIPEGTETTLTVKAEFTNGTTKDVTESATLSSNDTDVATVADDGTVIAEGAGTADLTAEFDGESDSVLAEVTDAEVVGGGLNVTLTDAELPEGAETTLSVEAEFTDGTTQDVTDSATLTSNDTDVATAAGDGTVTAEGEGTAQIEVSYDGESDSAGVTVTEAEVIDGGLNVTLTDAELPEGTETTLSVQAEFTNGSVQDVTEDAVLDSDDTTVATVAGDGTVTTNGEGTATLTADFGDESDTALIEATEADVADSGVTLTLADAELPAGTETTFSVEAELTNGTTLDVTEQATLVSDDTAVAVIDDDTISAAGEGTAQIEAIYDGETDAATLTVTPVEVIDDGLNITLSDAETPEGTETTVTVEAEFTNGSTQDVTEQATLSSSDGTVTTVAADGTVTAENAGTADLTAAYAGESDSAELTVTGAEVVDDGLTVSVADTQLPEGTETAVTVEAEFTNGSVQNVTDQAGLSSTDTAVATVENDGTITAEGEGTAQIEASYNDETESATISVTEAEITDDGLTVTLEDGEPPEGAETTVTVQAAFTNGTTQDVTEQTTLTSDDDAVATVENDGTVAAEGAGTAQIDASYEGESDSATLTVTDAEVIDGGLTLSLTDSELPEGTDTELTAEAEYTNGTTQNVTEQATLSSDDTDVATVDGDGTVTTEGEGTTQLTAEYGEESADLEVTVTEAKVIDSGVMVTITDAELPEGNQTTVTVDAEFTNGTVQDVTDDAVLTSDDTDVATVAGDGAVTAEDEGTTTLTAEFGGESDSALIEVTDAEVVDGGVTLALTESELPEGTETMLIVEAELTNGTTLDVTESATLTADDTDITTVADNGTVSAEGEGTATLTATYDGKSASTEVTVTEAEVVDDGVTVTLTDTEVPEGTETAVTVLAEYTNGTTQNVTGQAALTSNETGVATIDGDTISAEGEGTVGIDASYGGQSDSRTLTVTQAEVVDGGLTISITDAELPEGNETTITVEAEFTDGSVQNVTGEATITSADATIATVAGDGTVTAEGEGTVQIDAEFGDESESASLDVTEAALVSGGLTVMIDDDERPEGAETSVTVEAEFTNGTTLDVSDQATLSSTDDAVVTVDADGTVTAEGEGSAHIEAAYEGESDSADVTVTEAEVIDGGVSITLAESELPEGTETTVNVEAELTNGTVLDVTEDTDLSSSDAGVATVAADGTVTSEGEGTAQLTADYEDESNSVDITVTEANIVDEGLTLTLADSDLPEGVETTLTAHAELTNGTTQDVTEDATFDSSDSATVDVDTDGVVTAIGIGTADLTATYEGESDDAEVTVTDAEVVDGGLTVILDDSERPEGTETTLTVEAELTNGSVQNVTEAVTPTSDDTDIATVDDGIVTAQGEGSTQIEATYEGETDAAEVTVAEAEVVDGGLSLALANATIPEGTETTITVEAEFTNGSVQELTDAAVLGSDDTDVATVDDGTVTAMSVGMAELTAEFGGETDSASLEVTDAEVVDEGVAVTIEDVETPEGTETTLTVEAELTNGSVQDVTNHATFSSNDDAVAEIASNGTVNADGLGEADLTAAFGGESDSATVTVTDAEVIDGGLSVVLDDAEPPEGTQTTVVVEADLTNGTTQDVTADAALDSDDLGVVTVENDGTVVAEGEGTAQIDAEYQDEPDSVEVTVTEAEVVDDGVTITLTDEDVAEGTETTITVHAQYTNGTTADVTEQAVLSTDDESVATVAENGTVTAEGEGTAEIDAEFGGESASTGLPVTDAEVVGSGVTVSLDVDDLPEGTETTVIVEAELTNGTTQDVTAEADLSSADTDVATVENDGVVTAEGEGTAQISATFEGETGSEELTVTGAELIDDGVTVTLDDAEVPSGTATTITVHAEYTNGSVRNVTEEAVVTSADTDVATVVGDGTVTAEDEGTVQIAAEIGSESDSAELTVTEAEVVDDGLSATLAEDERPEGLETTLTVKATLTNGSTQDVTEDAALSSLDAGVATVDDHGTVTANGEGSVQIEAEYDGKTDTDELTVTAAEVVTGGVTVTTGDAETPDGTETTVTVEAEFTNGTVLNVTDQATLGSTDDAVVAVDGDGTVTAEGDGTAYVEAEYGGESDSADVTVTEAEVVDGGVSITLVDSELPDGTETTVSVEADLTNGTTATVTEDATVSSNDTAIAAVAPNGTVTTADVGNAEFTAEYGGESDSVGVTVTDAVVVEDGLNISVADSEVVSGNETAVSVEADLTNGTIQDVTGDAVLSSDDTAIATIAPDGTVTAIDGGTATISAEYGGETASQPVTVNDPAYFTVELAEQPENVTEGEALNVTAEVENVGDIKGTDDLSLLDFNGTVVDSEAVTLDAGENTTVTLGWSTDEGDSVSGPLTLETEHETVSTDSVAVEEPPSTAPEPAGEPSFGVSVDDVPETLHDGETGTVAITVENVGDTEGTQMIELHDFDGTVVDSESITLDAGESTTVSLAWQPGAADVGSGTLTIVTDDESVNTGSVTVREDDDEDAVDDTETTQVDGFVVSNPSNQEIAVTIVSSVSLDDVRVDIDGAASKTLRADDFDERSRDDAVVYTALFDGGSKGTYVATLVTDDDGDSDVLERSVSVTVDPLDDQEPDATNGDPEGAIVFEDLTVHYDGDYDIGVEARPVDLEAAALDGDRTGQRTAYDMTELSEDSQSFARATGEAPVGHLEIDAGTSEIENATIHFKVQKEHLARSGADADTVQLYRQSGDGWDPLETTRSGDADGYHHYAAETPGFSSFAVGVEAPLFEIEDATIAERTITAGDSAVVEITVENVGETSGAYPIELVIDDTVVESRTVTVPAAGSETVTFEPTFAGSGEKQIALGSTVVGTVTVVEESNLVVDGQFPWLLAVLALVLLVVGVVVVYRRQDEHQNQHQGE